MQIYEILLEKSLLRENDQILFYQFLHSFLGKEKKLCSPDCVSELFRTKYVNSDFKTPMKWNGLHCVVRMFYQVNEAQNYVFDLEPEKE